METKIPPPIVTLAFGLLIYFSKEIFPAIENQLTFYIGILLMVLGFFIFISAVTSFKSSKTTVNPLNPERATKLVTEKIFKYSRNPMYLGITAILGSLALFFNIVGGIIFTTLFCAYITKYQIIPEEKVMKNLFKEEFDEYKKTTRRWI